MESTVINVPDTRQMQHKLADYLTPSGWRDKLKTFIQAEDFEKILQALVKMHSKNERFTPPLKNIFNSFASCPYQDLKVVFIGPGPYDTFSFDEHNMADGLLFSHAKVSNGFIKWENKDFREAAGNRGTDPDLSSWAKQGVLLLNCALTATVDSNTAHYDLYKPFTTFVLDTLNAINQGLVFVFIGPEAKEFAELIDEKRHFVFILDRIGQSINANYIFGQIDKIVSDHYKTKINW